MVIEKISFPSKFLLSFFYYEFFLDHTMIFTCELMLQFPIFLYTFRNILPDNCPIPKCFEPILCSLFNFTVIKFLLQFGTNFFESIKFFYFIKISFNFRLDFVHFFILFDFSREFPFVDLHILSNHEKFHVRRIYDYMAFHVIGFN